MLLLGALVPTMRGFFDLSSAYQRLHLNSFAYHYVENTETNEVECEIQIHPSSPPCRQFAEHILTLIILMVRHHIGEGEYLRLTFQHNAPADMSLHNKTFQCPIDFNEDKTIAYMPLDFLDIEMGGKMGGKLQKLQPIVKTYLNMKMHKNPRFETSMAQTVEQLLPTIFGLQKSGVKHVADILEVSPKKLQRLLKDEEVTYSDILENVDTRLAII